MPPVLRPALRVWARCARAVPCSSCNGCLIVTPSGPVASFWASAAVAGRKRRHSEPLARKRLVGFGRATSDSFSRAVLWDIVVAGDLQGHGLGRRLVEELLHTPAVVGVERVYLMSTKRAGFTVAKVQGRESTEVNGVEALKQVQR